IARALLGCVLLAAVAAPARAQDRRLADRLDSATAASVGALVDSARAAGLPTEPLVQKALEGRALGADGARITAAVQALAGRLASARDALGGEASDAELTVAAGAIRSGVSVATIRRLQSLRGGRPLVVPLAVLTDLVAEGVPPDRAGASVLDLAREGRPDDAYLALRERAQSERRRGRGPAGPPAPTRPAADAPTPP
ncbi:MAG TPA: hypothetical protein VFK09_05520, partial [Gemmatimonadales bacterium]|nr:hypothetical protein [Gemmatimonadales bacterium]